MPSPKAFCKKLRRDGRPPLAWRDLRIFMRANIARLRLARRNLRSKDRLQTKPPRTSYSMGFPHLVRISRWFRPGIGDRSSVREVCHTQSPGKKTRRCIDSAFVQVSNDPDTEPMTSHPKTSDISSQTPSTTYGRSPRVQFRDALVAAPPPCAVTL